MDKNTLIKTGRDMQAQDSPQAKITLEISEGIHDEKPASVELTRRQWKSLERSHILDKLNNQEHCVQVTFNMKGECSGKLSLEEKFYLWWNAAKWDMEPKRGETHFDHLARVVKIAFMEGGSI